ncbi:MAG: HPr family phosphocarrier protein [Eubacteriales bacterium]|nr:HPr family phosphocarrier protein [Eubacteriales bacterium]
MKKFQYEIKDETGIHARPAGLLVKEAKEFKSNITVYAKGKSADATRLMAVMGMGVKCGDMVEVEADGPDEDEAIAAIENFFKVNL